MAAPLGEKLLTLQISFVVVEKLRERGSSLVERGDFESRSTTSAAPVEGGPRGCSADVAVAESPPRHSTRVRNLALDTLGLAINPCRFNPLPYPDNGKGF